MLITKTNKLINWKIMLIKCLKIETYKHHKSEL